MSRITIYFKHLDEEAKTPVRHYMYDVGYDLFTLNEVYVSVGAHRTIGTGISIEGMHDQGDKAYFAKIEPRSSTIKRGILVVPGTVDPGYEGELMIQVINFSSSDVKIERHARIAQLVFHEAILGYDSHEICGGRGDKGLGSTNKGE